MEVESPVWCGVLVVVVEIPGVVLGGVEKVPGGASVVEGGE